MKKINIISDILLYISLIGILFCNYLIFCYVPNEQYMGAIQRIFYFHVAAASSCYFAFAVCLFGSISFLGSKKSYVENIACAGAEIGFVLCSITLFSGMIWGYTAWNTIFNFEPRLVSFLLMWLIFLSYLIVRHSLGNKVISSIVGIFGGISIIPVVYSVKLLEKSKQLHPQVLEKSAITSEMKTTLLVCLFFIFIFSIQLIITRYRILRLEEK